MSGFLNRKWRQFFKRHSMRTSFTIVLLIVSINIVFYFLWNNYVTGSHELVERMYHVIDRADQTDDANSTTDMNYKVLYSLHSNASLPDCPNRPTNLIGRFLPDLVEYHWHVIESRYEMVHQGHWSPPCRPKQKLAVIIPYRNRGKHVRVLVNNLHAFLQRQQLDYGIFVVEQLPGTSFNRAMLFNIGYKESLKWYDFNCFVFHDVDLIPENDHNLYKCGHTPKHLSAYIDKFAYKLPYQDLFGGVCAIDIKQFKHVNGFSNFYFGWGGEDDDMARRLRFHGYRIFRYPTMIGSYKMMKHDGDSGNSANIWRFALVKSSILRMRKDGLNSLQYTVRNTNPTKLTIWLQVELDEASIKQNYSLWITKNFFDADLNYQLRVVVVVMLLFVGSLVVMCGIVMCAIKVTPDSFQPLLSNKVLIIDKSYSTTR